MKNLLVSHKPFEILRFAQNDIQKALFMPVQSIILRGCTQRGVHSAKRPIMEKISIVRRRSGRTRGVETLALLRARTRVEEQGRRYPLTRGADPDPEDVALLPRTEEEPRSVLPVSPDHGPDMDVEVMLGSNQVETLQTVLPLEDMEIGESREIPVVVARESAFKVVFQFEGDRGPLLTTQEVCQFLRVSRSFLYRKIHKGLVPCLRIGRRYRFRRKEVMEALTEQGGLFQPMDNRVVSIA